jgi:hypothetical protein
MRNTGAKNDTHSYSLLLRRRREKRTADREYGSVERMGRRRR